MKRTHLRPFPLFAGRVRAPRSAASSAAPALSRRSLAAVVAAQVAAAAAAQDEQKGQNVAKTAHSVPVAAGEQEQQEDDVVAPAAAVTEETVHDMYLLLNSDRSYHTIRIYVPPFELGSLLPHHTHFAAALTQRVRPAREPLSGTVAKGLSPRADGKRSAFSSG